LPSAQFALPLDIDNPVAATLRCPSGWTHTRYLRICDRSGAVRGDVTIHWRPRSARRRPPEQVMIIRASCVMQASDDHIHC